MHPIQVSFDTYLTEVFPFREAAKAKAVEVNPPNDAWWLDSRKIPFLQGGNLVRPAPAEPTACKGVLSTRSPSRLITGQSLALLSLCIGVGVGLATADPLLGVAAGLGAAAILALADLAWCTLYGAPQRAWLAQGFIALWAGGRAVLAVVREIVSPAEREGLATAEKFRLWRECVLKPCRLSECFHSNDSMLVRVDWTLPDCLAHLWEAMASRDNFRSAIALKALPSSWVAAAQKCLEASRAGAAPASLQREIRWCLQHLLLPGQEDLFADASPDKNFNRVRYWLGQRELLVHPDKYNERHAPAGHATKHVKPEDALAQAKAVVQLIHDMRDIVDLTPWGRALCYQRRPDDLPLLVVSSQ